jgi:hypothetical protein
MIWCKRNNALHKGKFKPISYKLVNIKFIQIQQVVWTATELNLNKLYRQFNNETDENKKQAILDTTKKRIKDFKKYWITDKYEFQISSFAQFILTINIQPTNHNNNNL